MSKELLLNLDEILEQKQTVLIPENIRKGTTILGVTGNFEGEVNTNDATASASDLLYNKTAYVNGEKITGTIPVQLGYTEATVNNAYSYDTQFIIRNDTGSGIYLENTAGLVVDPTVVTNAIRLTPDILKEGSTVCGIIGTLKIGVDTTDATATADQIELNKVAYVQGERLVGTLPYHDNEVAYEIDTTDAISTSTDGLILTPIIPQKEIMNTDSILKVSVTNAQLASALNITGSQIVQGNTILGVAGTKEPLPDKTTKITSGTTISTNNAVSTSGSSLVFQHIHTTPLLINSSVQVGYSIPYNTVANFIGVTADVVKSGTTILGIEGTYIGEAGTGTEDATATETDILEGKTAYVNKIKITGTIPVKESVVYKPGVSSVQYTYSETDGYRLNITSSNVKGSYSNGVLLKDSTIMLQLTNSQLASALGLTADMIADGVTFLGITGTHTGNGMLTETEYNEIETIADNILAEEVE